MGMRKRPHLLFDRRSTRFPYVLRAHRSANCGQPIERRFLTPALSMSSPVTTSYPQLRTNDVLRSLENKRVLVTGGAGFVGSVLSTRLVELGARVTVLDDLSTGRTELLPGGLERFVEGSVTDETLVRTLVAESALVFHLAVRNIIVSTTELRSDFETNIGGTLNVLLAARDAPAVERVLYTSSVSIYGNPRALPISEQDGVSILSPYAASKLAGESYCSAFFEMFQLPTTIVRYSNVFGRHQSPRNPYCGVVSKFFHSCFSGEPILIHGSGAQTRDFTYVDDAVEATILAALIPRAEGDTFNIGSGQEISIRALAHLVKQTTNVEVAIKSIDRRDIDNVQRRVLNIEKARRVLRWTPQRTMEEGLQLTHDWLREHAKLGGVA